MYHATRSTNNTKCYVASLKVTPFSQAKKSRGAEAITVDLNPQTNTDDHIQPQGDIKLFVLEKMRNNVYRRKAGKSR